jgi:hypothetical protein
MRQATIGSALRGLLAHSSNYRCRVEALEAADVNAPGWETTLPEIDLHVQEMTVRERVATAEEYSPRQTHLGYAEMTTELTPGSRLVETHRRNEHGAWTPVEEAAAQRWQVLGLIYLSGTPDPQTQVELHLHRLGPVR